MEQTKKIDKRICYDLQEMTNQLVSNIENLINEYEEATGLSIQGMKICDEGNCKNSVHLLIDYYNFDNSMVRRTEE